MVAGPKVGSPCEPGWSNEHETVPAVVATTEGDYMTKILRFIAEAAKFLAAATGAVAVAVSLGLLTGDTQKWVTGALTVATAFCVYLIKNAPPATPLPLPGVVLAGQVDTKTAEPK